MPDLIATLAQATINADTTGLTATGQAAVWHPAPIDLPMLIGRIISVAIELIGVVVFILLVYGGYVWMTARGDKDKVDTAQKLIANAVIGLAVVLLRLRHRQLCPQRSGAYHRFGLYTFPIMNFPYDPFTHAYSQGGRPWRLRSWAPLPSSTRRASNLRPRRPARRSTKHRANGYWHKHRPEPASSTPLERW